MRTTLNIDDELMRQAKKFALRRHLTLTRFVEEGLRKEIQDSAGRSRHVTFPVSHAKINLPPGMDLNDTSALLDYLDELESRDAAS